MAANGYTTRKAAFKQLDSANGNLDTFMYHLLNVKMVYEKEHPDIANHCQALATSGLLLQQALTNFRQSF